MKYHKIPRVRLFAELIGLFSSEYSFEALLFYIDAISEISADKQSGFHLNGEFVVFERQLIKTLIAQKLAAFGKREEIRAMYEVVRQSQRVDRQP